jgi:hypothetical protein
MCSSLLKQIPDRILMFIVLEVIIITDYTQAKLIICYTLVVEFVFILMPILMICIYLDLNGKSVTDIVMLIHQLKAIFFTLEGWIQEVPHQKQHTLNSLAFQSEKN